MNTPEFTYEDNILINKFEEFLLYKIEDKPWNYDTILLNASTFFDQDFYIRVKLLEEMIGSTLKSNPACLLLLGRTGVGKTTVTYKVLRDLEKAEKSRFVHIVLSVEDIEHFEADRAHAQSWLQRRVKTALIEKIESCTNLSLTEAVLRYAAILPSNTSELGEDAQTYKQNLKQFYEFRVMEGKSDATGTNFSQWMELYFRQYTKELLDATKTFIESLTLRTLCDILIQVDPDDVRRIFIWVDNVEALNSDGVCANAFGAVTRAAETRHELSTLMMTSRPRTFSLAQTDMDAGRHSFTIADLDPWTDPLLELSFRFSGDSHDRVADGGVIDNEQLAQPLHYITLFRARLKAFEALPSVSRRPLVARYLKFVDSVLSASLNRRALISDIALICNGCGRQIVYLAYHVAKFVWTNRPELRHEIESVMTREGGLSGVPFVAEKLRSSLLHALAKMANLQVSDLIGIPNLTALCRRSSEVDEGGSDSMELVNLSVLHALSVKWPRIQDLANVGPGRRLRVVEVDGLTHASEAAGFRFEFFRSLSHLATEDRFHQSCIEIAAKVGEFVVKRPVVVGFRQPNGNRQIHLAGQVALSSRGVYFVNILLRRFEFWRESLVGEPDRVNANHLTYRDLLFVMSGVVDLADAELRLVAEIARRKRTSLWDAMTLYRNLLAIPKDGYVWRPILFSFRGYLEHLLEVSAGEMIRNEDEPAISRFVLTEGYSEVRLSHEPAERVFERERTERTLRQLMEDVSAAFSLAVGSGSMAMSIRDRIRWLDDEMRQAGALSGTR